MGKKKHKKNGKTTIMLADSHLVMREGLTALFAKHPDMEVIGEADDGAKAVKLAKKLSPDVIVMDINLLNVDGIQATRRIVSDNPKARVLAFSIYTNRQFVSAMFRAGASGYVLKQLSFAELVKGIKALMDGKTYLCSSLEDMVVEEYKNQLVNFSSRGSSELKDLEREILRLYSSGMSSKEIAVETGKSPKTIDAYRRVINKKLQINNTADLIKYAIRAGFTSLDA